MRVTAAHAGQHADRHYADVRLIGRRGEQVAVELVLTSNGQQRLEALMVRYAADPNIVAVLYLTETTVVRHTITRTAARLGLTNLIHAKPVAMP